MTTRLLVSPLLFLSGLLCLQIAMTTQPVPQHPTRTIVSHHKVIAKLTHTPFPMPPTSTSVATIMPGPPSAASLNLSNDKQHWINVAYQDAIDAESSKEDAVFPMLYVRQIKQESGFQVAVQSGAGAIGIAQFMASTAASLGVNPYDPVQSLKGGAILMASYVHTYRSYALALAAYNAGPGAINACLHTDNWFACLPLETRNYITIILS